MKKRKFIGRRPRQASVERKVSHKLVRAGDFSPARCRVKDEEEAAVPLCAQHRQGSLVNRTVVLLMFNP